MRKFYYHKDKEVLFRFLINIWLEVRQTQINWDYYYMFDHGSKISYVSTHILTDFLESDTDSEHIEAHEPVKYNHISKFKI